MSSASVQNGDRTYGVTSSSSVSNRVDWLNLISSNAFLRHLPLYQLLVGQEVDAVSRGFTEESDPLALVNTSNSPLTVDLLYGIPRSVVQTVGIGLGLQTYHTVGRVALVLLTRLTYTDMFHWS